MKTFKDWIFKNFGHTPHLAFYDVTDMEDAYNAGYKAALVERQSSFDQETLSKL